MVSELKDVRLHSIPVLCFSRSNDATCGRNEIDIVACECVFNIVSTNAELMEWDLTSSIYSVLF